uniref:Uncharacterized protein n=1 Tax=Solanum tuberosum TaxID=4113 RepID=M0ZR62_SOLTU
MESTAGFSAYQWNAKICKHIILPSTIFQLKKLKNLTLRLHELTKNFLTLIKNGFKLEER